MVFLIKLLLILYIQNDTYVDIACSLPTGSLVFSLSNNMVVKFQFSLMVICSITNSE